MATATAALLTALSQAATWVGSTVAAGASAIGSLGGAAATAGSSAAATGAAAASGLTPELLIASGIDTTAAAVGAGGTGAAAAGAGTAAATGGLFTAQNLAAAAAIGSAGAGIIEATKGVPSPDRPPTPPASPTMADARLSGVSLDQQARAAAAAGAVAGFSGTVKNKGGAQGIALGGRYAPLAKASLF